MNRKLGMLALIGTILLSAHALGTASARPTTLAVNAGAVCDPSSCEPCPMPCATAVTECDEVCPLPCAPAEQVAATE